MVAENAKQRQNMEKPTMNRLGMAVFGTTLYLVLGASCGVEAAIISPGSNPFIAHNPPTTISIWTGTETGQAEINAVIAGYMGPSVDVDNPLYKQDLSPLTEAGSFATSYSTTFANSPSDPEDATITYGSGSFISTNKIYALVKDGNHTPAWYLFDISPWNGTETLEFQDFWPNGGAISHVTLYGGGGPKLTPPPAVPEPGTMAMWALGLALCGSARMWRNRRKCVA